MSGRGRGSLAKQGRFGSIFSKKQETHDSPTTHSDAAPDDHKTAPGTSLDTPKQHEQNDQQAQSNDNLAKSTAENDVEGDDTYMDVDSQLQSSSSSESDNEGISTPIISSQYEKNHRLNTEPSQGTSATTNDISIGSPSLGSFSLMDDGSQSTPMTSSSSELPFSSCSVDLGNTPASFDLGSASSSSAMTFTPFSASSLSLSQLTASSQSRPEGTQRSATTATQNSQLTPQSSEASPDQSQCDTSSLFQFKTNKPKRTDSTTKFRAMLGRSPSTGGTPRKRKLDDHTDSQTKVSESDTQEPARKRIRVSQDDNHSVNGVTFHSFQLSLSPKQKAAEPTFELLPVDWTLKFSARFKSSTSFAWCKEIPSPAEARAISLYSRCHLEALPSQPETSELLNLLVEPSSDQKGSTVSTEQSTQFEKSLYYFVSPSNPLSDEVVLMLKTIKEKEEAIRTQFERALFNDWQKRKEEWSEGFSSLFSLFTNKHCHYFYYYLKHSCVLFLAPGLAGNDRFVAIMSRSTKKLRDELDAAGLNYKMPFKSRPRKPQSNKDKDQSEKELSELSKILPGQTKHHIAEAQFDGKEESLVTFTGPTAVRRLFDFLLNCCVEDRDLQLPLLYSNVCFINSALKRLQLETKKVLRANEITGAMETYFTLDLLGVIFPDSVIQLCELFKVTQGSFSVSLETHLTTIGFNEASHPSTTPTPSPSDLWFRTADGAGWIPDQLMRAPEFTNSTKTITYNADTNKYSVTT